MMAGLFTVTLVLNLRSRTWSVLKQIDHSGKLPGTSAHRQHRRRVATEPILSRWHLPLSASLAITSVALPGWPMKSALIPCFLKNARMGLRTPSPLRGGADRVYQ